MSRISMIRIRYLTNQEYFNLQEYITKRNAMLSDIDDSCPRPFYEVVAVGSVRGSPSIYEDVDIAVNLPEREEFSPEARAKIKDSLDKLMGFIDS